MVIALKLGLENEQFHYMKLVHGPRPDNDTQCYWSPMKWLIFALLSLPVHALDARFEGTVDLSNCSGFVFTTTQTDPTGPALMMTNGHCLTTLLGGIVLSPGEARADRPGSRSVSIVNAEGKKLKMKTTRLLYATMTGTDMAVYELPLTYQELATRGIRPFMLGSTPAQGEAVEVYSAHKNNAHACTVAAITNTREGGFHFIDSLRLSPECRQGNGTSGSPVVRAGTRDVIAIANSYNKNGRACGNNNPCEVNGEEVSVQFTARYAQQIAGLTDCLSDFMSAECGLTKP